jgi:hypothetical protein
MPWIPAGPYRSTSLCHAMRLPVEILDDAISRIIDVGHISAADRFQQIQHIDQPMLLKSERDEPDGPE